MQLPSLFLVIILFQNSFPLDTHQKQRAHIECLSLKGETATNIYRRLVNVQK